MFRSYRRRPLANPFYPKSEKRRSWKLILLLCLVGLAVLGVGGFFAWKKFSPPPATTPEAIEPSPIAAWQTGEHLILISEAGEVLRDTSLEELSSLELIRLVDESQTATNDKPVISREKLNSVLTTQEQLKGRLNLSISQVVFSSPESTWIRLVTSEGWELFLTFNEDTGQQLDKLTTILEQEKINRTSLKYIDVRFSDRVYYK